LPEQPLDDLDPAVQVFRQELAGFLCEVLEDRSRFEDADQAAADGWRIVDDRRDPVIGRDPQELGLELIAPADVDRQDAVREAGLFEEDGDLVPIRGGPVIEIDHDSILSRLGGSVRPVEQGESRPHHSFQ